MDACVLRWSLVAGVLFAAVGSMVVAGPIDPPPGPVESTMKTLDEVEARIPISQETTPGDADAKFVITESGSYYLTGNETVIGTLNLPDPGITPRDGIRVLADDVTIDLNGYALQAGSGARWGIITISTDGLRNTVVRNGTVRGFDRSGIVISVGPGTNPFRGSGRVEDVRAIECVQEGGISPAIDARECVVVRCLVEGSEGDGIAGRIVVECLARGNDDTGISADIARDCVSEDNDLGFVIAQSAERCVARRNVGTGFVSFTPCRMVSCTSEGNGDDGFNVATATLIECVARSNADVGILVGDSSRVESCESIGNTTGYETGRNHDSLFVRNIAEGNTLRNWLIQTGNTCEVRILPRTSPVVGDEGGLVIDFGPWVNFTRP